MDVATKQMKWKQFKASDMGEESYASMVFFASNILYMDRLLILEGLFLENLEKGELESQIPPDQRLKIVQAGQMDALSKIMMMMESMFVTIGAFQDDKKKLASKLQEYGPQDVWEVVNGILNDKFSIADYWKIMGFPDTKKLGLTPLGTRLIEKMLSAVLEEFAKTLRWLATFYEQHSRLSDKFKHGLAVRFGYKKQIAEIEGPQELLMAFDDKPLRKRKTVNPIRRSATVSLPRIIVSKSDSSAWEKYSKAMSYTRKVVLFIVKNNMVRLQNCNADFIPYDFDTEGNKESMHFPATLTENDVRHLKRILLKLEKATYYKEDKVLDYGLLNKTILGEVLQRLGSEEDVVEVE